MFFTPNGISFPPELATILEREVVQKLSAKSRSSLPELWKRLAREKGIQQKGTNHYSFQKDFVNLYASYYLPANLMKMSLVLEEAFLLGNDLMPENSRWLDIGTGPGTALWGAQWWAEKRQKSFSFLGLDQSSHFLDLAGSLARALGAKQARFEKMGQLLEAIEKFRPTTISFMNSFTEIYPQEEEKIKALESIGKKAQSLSHPLRLVIIEPGTMEISRALSLSKDAIVQSGNVKVLFPCLDNRKCGALEKPKDWCHEEVACTFPEWFNEIGQGMQMQKDSLIFSYLVLEFKREQTSSEVARVVSQRLERKGQVECWICTGEGKQFARSQRSKADASLDLVTNCNRGDLWKDWALEPKGDLIRGSRISPLQSIF